MTSREERIRKQLEAGLAVPVNLSTDKELIAWAKERELFVRVDRRSVGHDRHDPRFRQGCGEA